MSGGDDWQPGDLALCVYTGGLSWGPVPEPCDPEPGSINTVEAVDGTPGDPGLWFVGVPSNDSYSADYFRKIKPLTDEEREEALREMNQPVREVVQ